MSTSYPFPFVGAGDAQYFEWAEVHVLFEREPTKDEKAAIAKRVPPPLVDDEPRFDGRHLAVASDQFAHAWIMEHYDKDPDDESEDDVEGRFPFACDSKVDAFNADIEAWLKEAHQHCPIAVAVRHQDWEAGGTELSAWHDWSIAQADQILAWFGTDVDDDDPRRWMLGVILEEIEEAGGEVPVPYQVYGE